MQFNMHADQKKGTLILSGEITLLQVQELMALLNQALAACDHIILDTEEVTHIDAAGLQLLCAAHKSAIEHNKHLVLAPTRPDELVSKISQAGLWRQQQCFGLKNTHCLWTGGDQ